MTLAQAQEAKLMQLYDWCLPTEKIPTVNGIISAFDWLEMEKHRIEKDPQRIAVIVCDGLLKTLFVDPIAEMVDAA